mgnify:FL=1
MDKTKWFTKNSRWNKLNSFKKGAKNLGKGGKIVAILSTIVIIAYIISAIYLLIIHPTDTYVISQGTISQEDETVGYIIRDEEVKKSTNYQNGIYAIASEGQRVAINEPVFRYYSDSEKQITAQINEINYQIQELLEKDKSITSADIKAIESQIEEKIEDVNTLNNYQEINEYKKNIDTLISKKISFIGDVTENKEIKKLIKQRSTLENSFKNSSEYQRAPKSGIVSYRVDGLEEKLSSKDFNIINEQYLNKLELKTGQIVSASNECGKVIDNFKCYIAITMNSKEAMEAKVGDKVKLRISNNEEDAQIIQINEESGKRTIIFQLNVMTTDLINHRKIAIDVVWWDVTGLKVPNQALIQENGLYYVTRNKAGVQSKILVKVKKQTEKYAIIDSYKNEELQELGLDAQAIKNYKKISNYDEVIIKE